MIRRVTIIALALTLAAMAADVSGKWTARVFPSQDFENTFTFKVDGNKPTGTMSTFTGGEVAIENGKVEGDTISFTVTVGSDNTSKFNFTGHIAGDEIHFKREGGLRGESREFTAKRAK